MSDGGFLIPTQFRKHIDYMMRNMQTYYDTETKQYRRIIVEEAPIVIRKYPRWKFWKHGFLVLKTRSD